jgi:hypothetical protein
MERRITMKRLGVVLAVALLVGGTVGIAQAQSAATPPESAYHGSLGPAASYPPDYYGIQGLKGFVSEGRAGGYVGYPPDYSNTPNSSGWIHMKEESVVGKITELDLPHKTLALDNGMEFMLAPSFEFTSDPALGQEVEVIYEEQGAQKIAHSVDVGFEGRGSD